ncbi:PREDICTED: uncharacterized protein LOC104728850 [Camelina sativa]|uniref:Uncharacterized protein LOC104728850 n=1 Tax=Camelina sativa TaxID=90675 RepID=A0ABM0UTG8_CAMSA|nr:PREDICTED: uncharacterized protein LOC104728850 [Camelina sativa]
MVSQSWVCSSVKALKPVLRKLNKAHFSGISQRVKAEEQKLDILQRAILTNPSEKLAREERLVREKWKFLSNAEEKFIRQKSQIKWAHLGDRNTTFLHKMVIARTNKNHIHFLQDQSGRRINESAELKEHAAGFFEEILGSTDLPHSPCSIEALEDLLSFRCSEVHKLNLVRDVTEEEIRATVFALPSEKCPRPDGYSVEFFRASWSVVGANVVVTFPEACKLGDYRLISCCNLVYKVISKITANRLKPILKECISPNQATFLKGRLLGEKVLLASELIKNYQKSSCQESFMLKVDIKKAFVRSVGTLCKAVGGSRVSSIILYMDQGMHHIT